MNTETINDLIHILDLEKGKVSPKLRHKNAFKGIDTRTPRVKRILKEAESSADKLKTQARRNIEHEFERAKLALQEEIFESSLAKAEEIIKNKISEDDQNRIVDEYLKKVVA